MRTEKVQIRLRIDTVWSVPLLCSKIANYFVHEQRKPSEAARMLIIAFAD